MKIGNVYKMKEGITLEFFNQSLFTSPIDDDKIKIFNAYKKEPCEVVSGSAHINLYRIRTGNGYGYYTYYFDDDDINVMFDLVE